MGRKLTTDLSLGCGKDKSNHNDDHKYYDLCHTKSKRYSPFTKRSNTSMISTRAVLANKVAYKEKRKVLES